jgi:hypothetical protein
MRTLTGGDESPLSPESTAHSSYEHRVMTNIFLFMNNNFYQIRFLLSSFK